VCTGAQSDINIGEKRGKEERERDRRVSTFTETRGSFILSGVCVCLIISAGVSGSGIIIIRVTRCNEIRRYRTPQAPRFSYSLDVPFSPSLHAHTHTPSH